MDAGTECWDAWDASSCLRAPMGSFLLHSLDPNITQGLGNLIRQHNTSIEGLWLNPRV